MVGSKEQLRRRLRQARATIPPDLASAAAERAASHALALPALADARSVALYAAVHGELDPLPLAAALRARGVRLAYPRVLLDAHRLQFHWVDDPRELAPGAFRILEPPATAPDAAVGAIDVFVLPGLAFDRTGTRLGWGRGFYDRTLAGYDAAMRVGYCYQSQLLAQVPRERDDLAMHYVVTEAGVLRPDPAHATAPT